MKKHFFSLLACASLAVSAYADPVVTGELSAKSSEIPITSLPITITKPGSYYFIADMYYAATTEPTPIATEAITVNAPGPVTINMRGFSLTGPNQQFLGEFYTNPIAILIESSNITIKHGSIVGFFTPQELRLHRSRERVIYRDCGSG